MAAPWVESPGISAPRFIRKITPIQNAGPGRERMKPVKMGSPQ